MKEKLIERVAKLLCIKSLVTLALTILFVVVALRGAIPQEVMTVFTTVIGFYFGTQATKE
jgi:hypothetical protein